MSQEIIKFPFNFDFKIVCKNCGNVNNHLITINSKTYLECENCNHSCKFPIFENVSENILQDLMSVYIEDDEVGEEISRIIDKYS